MLLDVGGQDATEAFEDVGHSDEAREILNGLLIGNLKRQVLTPSHPKSSGKATRLTDQISSTQEGDPKPKTTTTQTPQLGQKESAAGLGIGVYALVLVGAALAFFAYQYLQGQSQKS